jgi:hypothetical protein
LMTTANDPTVQRSNDPTIQRSKGSRSSEPLELVPASWLLRL